LEAARRAFDKRVVVAFQPHRYTRTEQLFEEFTRAFNTADVVFLTDIYAAGERPIAGVTSERLSDAIRAHGHHQVSYVSDRAELSNKIARLVQPGDAVIALGAGDINRVLSTIAADIRAKQQGATD
jgi:UDP-N-acetylmuramate--alanine ligase